MKPNDYLESVFETAFKREVGLDEDIARTLPFFAASLALVATLLGYLLRELQTLEWNTISVVLHLMLGCAAVSLAMALHALFQTVQMREYRLPPRETELIAWSEQLRTFYQSQNYKPSTVDQRVFEDLRDRMLLEYAESAEHNRLANKSKLQGRARGFALIVITLVIAFFTIGTMFIAQRVTSLSNPGPRHELDTQASETAHPAPQRADAQPAAPAGTAGSAPRGEVPGRGGRQHGEQVSETPKAPAAPAAAPAAAAPAPAAAQKPPAPAHQLLKKSESGGGPIIGAPPTERR